MIDAVKDLCCGCNVCADACPQGAISFNVFSEGFLYPVIDYEKCTRCNICERICPALEIEQGNKTKYSLALYSNEKPINSSSGGAFSVIAIPVLKSGGIVYGASFRSDMTLSHIRISQLSDLSLLCGSKYIQSDCRGIYKQILGDLKSGLKVLFTGTPCQVAGLRKFLRKDYSNLLIIDLICHGVPSPGIFKDYIDYCSKLRGRRVAEFLTRDNRDGWDNRFRSTIKYVGGKEEYNTMLSNLWNRIFFSEMAIRKSCCTCRFASMDRQGDFTIGDFWGIENVNKSMYNRNGVSLVLVNTEKGKEWFEKNCRQKLICSEACTNEKEHPNLYHPTQQSHKRADFMNDYKMNGFSFIADKYFAYNRMLDFKVRIKNVINKILLNK